MPVFKTGKLGLAGMFKKCGEIETRSPGRLFLMPSILCRPFEILPPQIKMPEKPFKPRVNGAFKYLQIKLIVNILLRLKTLQPIYAQQTNLNLSSGLPPKGVLILRQIFLARKNKKWLSVLWLAPPED